MLRTYIAFYLVFCTSIVVQGDVELCDTFQSPIAVRSNCTLTCSLRFNRAVTDMHSGEVALCLKNSSFSVSCKSHTDCRSYHVGAYCKSIPCLCKISKEYENYIIDSSQPIPKWDTCVVPAKHLDPELPLVPFPWKTLLFVAGIVLVFGSCLLCLRWLSPVLRSLKAKRTARSTVTRQEEPAEDSTGLFSSVPQQQTEINPTPFAYYLPRGVPRIYRASRRPISNNPRASARLHRYAMCATAETTLSGTMSNQDKPPPYEAAIQMPPPTYEDVERAIVRENRRNSRSTETVEVHVSSAAGSTPGAASSNTELPTL